MKKNIKKMIDDRLVNRRQFLIGAGGKILFLPPLLSLMCERSQAATVAAKRLCLFPMQLGMHTSYLRPTDAQLAGQLTRIAPDIQSASLTALPKPVSFVVDNDFNDLLGDMNIFFGLGLSHGGGHSFGHFCSSSAAIPSDNTNRKPSYGKSIDVIIEQSAVFRSSFSGGLPTLRASTKRSQTSKSWDRNEGAEFPTPMPFYTGDQALFDAVFGSTTIPMAEVTKLAARKTLIVDTVLEDLQGLQKNKRLSSVDKEMLDRYISSLNDLEKNIAASAAAAACTRPVFTSQMSSSGTLTGSVDQLFRNYNEIVTLAFACDQSRMFMLDNHYGSSSGQSLPHHEADDIENKATDRNKWYIKKMADMARRMKAFPDPSGSGSILDNSLFIMINEHSQRRSHSVQDIPVLTFGSLGGAVRTGLYLDYRLEGNPSFKKDPARPYGYPTKQLLQTAMLAMGVPKTEYTKYGDANGFGQFSTEASTSYHAKFVATHNDALPYFSKI